GEDGGHLLAQLEHRLGLGAVLGVGLLELGVQRGQRLHATRHLGRIRTGRRGLLGIGAVVGVVVLVGLGVAVGGGGLGVRGFLAVGGGLHFRGLFLVVEADHDLGQAL